MTRRRWAALSAVLLVANLIPYLHARAMTHFVAGGARTKSPEHLSAAGKLAVLLAGVNLPRPADKAEPKDFGLESRTVTFPGAGGLPAQAWLVRAAKSRGLVIMFHGYADSKSSLLTAAKEFHGFGYDALLVDFNGSGGSAGDDTTLGWREADVVASAVRWSSDNGHGTPVLFGLSMGAAAVLRAVGALGVDAKGIVVEAPFDRLLNSARHRFEKMGLPPFPLSQLLVFWGGVAQGFDGFALNPVEYAKSVRCPALLIFGDQDPYIRTAEEKGIFDSLAGPKRYKVFQGIGHVDFARERPDEWRAAVKPFLASL